MCLTASNRSAGIAILPRAAGALQGKGGEEVKNNCFSSIRKISNGNFPGGLHALKEFPMEIFKLQRLRLG